MNSTVSSATTFQRRKALNSPEFLSTSTRMSASSVKRFFVAEASASSSAPNTTSRFTFFSRASASTSSSISRLISALSGLQVRHQPGPIQCIQLQRHILSIDLQGGDPVLGAAQHAREALASRRIRRAHPHFRPAPGKTLEILFLAQGAVQPRRGHFQPVVLHALGREQVRQVAAYRGTVVNRDACPCTLGAVDE